MFYTYAHYTPQGRLFYIGKGSTIQRAHHFHGRNDYWRKIVAKYGKPLVKIIAEWDIEKDALTHEKLLISSLRFLGFELCNLTDGGEGTSGYKHSQEHIEKNRRAKLGSIPWNKGISSGLKHSEEFKQRISALHKGNKWRLGLTPSDKQKQTASKLFKGNTYAAGNTNNRTWAWVGTDIKTGEVIRLIGEKAMKEAGVQHANIIKCINGERKSHKGCTWEKELIKDILWL